ncbi:hypothetical protein CR194_15405 [Salipaludibacillus keqinensis]|uniref:Isoprenylcysteine carboxyl methyltransferase n=1 Tax=Salipaludibacillus keqinensis TaxID=2045207 RepID=A0A323TDC6_9BACI|nr:isoprenylcysteine carboxylmethyltransferase family protein [Salipaludibacillus keqinensis]PYZ92224.1 hypothetical protein CR194_15405 [Salipaludibacillus keqinensis]
MVFSVLWTIVVVQRVMELAYAKRNERWMRERGAIEYGQSHYKWIVFIHVGFFVVLLMEWFVGVGALHPFWPALTGIFLILQGMRIGVLVSLGRFWNTKILVIPGEKLVSKGLYRGRLRHPNYLIVSMELFLFPLIFQAYFTAILFTVINTLFLLFVRIPVEEEALGVTGSPSVLKE